MNEPIPIRLIVRTIDSIRAVNPDVDFNRMLADFAFEDRGAWMIDGLPEPIRDRIRRQEQWSAR